jgi:hypothetical protein
MTHQIDATIARIPGMTAQSCAALRRNAEADLAKSPDDAAARRLLDALDAFEAGRAKPTELEVTGLLSWEKHRAGQATFRAFHGAEVVGRIFKRADHSSVEKDVYSVEIDGVTLPGAFHHIRDAREAGERAFAASRDSVTP